MSTTDFKGTENRHKAAQQMIDELHEQVMQTLIKSAEKRLKTGLMLALMGVAK